MYRKAYKVMVQKRSMQELIRSSTTPQRRIPESDSSQYNIAEPNKPIKPGDYISIWTSHFILIGRVLSIGIGHIKLKTCSGSIITIPDHILDNATVTRISMEDRSLHQAAESTATMKKAVLTT
jgi:hypothetical protein